MSLDLGLTRHGNPRRSRPQQLSVAIDPDTLEQIDRAAKREDISRSEWIRQRLEWALEDSQ